MKILMICKRYYTNRDLFERFGRLYHIPKALSERGHSIVVVALNYRNFNFESLQQGSMTIYSCPLINFLNPAFWLKVISVTIRRDFDVVLSSGDSYFGFAGLVLSKMLHAVAIFDVYDDYRLFRSNRVPFFKAMFSAAVRHSEGVVFASRKLIPLAKGTSGQVVLCPQGIETSRFDQCSQNEARIALGLNREGVFITYAGSIDERIDFTTLKEACRVLSAKKYNVKLLLAGSASQNGIQGCEFIIYLGNLPFAQVPTLLSASDILVLPYNESPLSVTANPCKVPEYLASQRPIVFSKTTNIEFPLKISDEQLYVAGSVKSLIAAIEWCLENKPICSYQEDFSWLNQSKALVEFVESKRIDKCLYQS